MASLDRRVTVGLVVFVLLNVRTFQKVLDPRRSVRDDSLYSDLCLDLLLCGSRVAVFWQ